MSAPVSATITSAVVLEIPGIEVTMATAASKGTRRVVISSVSAAIERSRKSMWSMIWRQTIGVVGAEVTRQRLFELGDLRAHPALGHLGEHRGVAGRRRSAPR